MAEVTTQPDGSAQITITQTETAGLKAMVGQHLPALKRIGSWFEADVAPELKQAATFFESLSANPPEGSTLTVTPGEAQALHGLLQAHVPDFEQVLAVVESPAVRSLLSLAAGVAKALL